MASFNKFNALSEFVWEAGVNLQTDALKVMLTNTLPVATNSLYGDISANELTGATGYAAGGAAVTTTSSSQTSGLYKYIGSCANPTWTAGAAWPSFRYVVIYDFTPTTPLKPLLGWWDFGSAVTLNSGDTFTVQLDGINGVIQMS